MALTHFPDNFNLALEVLSHLSIHTLQLGCPESRCARVVQTLCHRALNHWFQSQDTLVDYFSVNGHIFYYKLRLNTYQNITIKYIFYKFFGSISLNLVKIIEILEFVFIRLPLIVVLLS